MTHHASPSTTFAGFPTYDDQAPDEPQIAVIGVPYLSPYPMEKSYLKLYWCRGSQRSI